MRRDLLDCLQHPGLQQLEKVSGAWRDGQGLRRLSGGWLLEGTRERAGPDGGTLPCRWECGDLRRFLLGRGVVVGD